MAFISVDECIAKLLASSIKASSQKKKNTSLLDAKGLVIAQDITSSIDVPPADNSAMDGYAIRFSDIEHNSDTVLAISQRIQAGDKTQPLKAGTAARIFTGAEIPLGANTVVMQENATEKSNSVSFNSDAKANSNIRKQGQDIKTGEVVLKQGHRLRGQDIGLLASIGIAKVATYEPLKIAVANTGNELVNPGNELKEGQIYNSNKFLLDGLLKEWGFHVSHSDIITDSLQSTKTALQQLSLDNDIIITTGGVSVGEEDHIKPAVTALGKLSIWKVAIKPGKPFAFGQIGSTPFIGLPGNPASAFVTLLVLARPYLLQQQGLATQQFTAVTYTATAEFDQKTAKREEYLRAKFRSSIKNNTTEENMIKASVDGSVNATVELYPNQSSGVLKSASWGNCFVKQAVGTSIKKGDLVTIIPYNSL